MSWCGGGEISATPGVVCRRRAISTETLWPGSWPPSPGFEPCAILIWSSSAKAAYSGVTPNRPEATCLIRELRSVRKRAGSSPPSPQFDRAWRLLNAAAIVSCASAEIEPYDMAPVENRFRIELTGSTSSIGIGVRAGAGRPVPASATGPGGGPASPSTPRMRSRPRSVISRADCRSTRSVYSANTSRRPVLVACCSRNTASGLNRCGSPSRRHW